MKIQTEDLNTSLSNNNSEHTMIFIPTVLKKYTLQIIFNQTLIPASL